MLWRKRPDIGPPPTDTETRLLRERLERNTAIGASLGGALGGGIAGGALTIGAGSAGARRGARRSFDASFDRSPSVVREQTFRSRGDMAVAQVEIENAIRAAGAKGDVRQGVPTLLTRRIRVVVLTYSIEGSESSGSVIHVRLAERDTSHLIDALLTEFDRTFERNE